MSTHWYAIEPRAPLVFRSGKPFHAGIRDGANFPWPSAVAGMVRSRVMDDQGWLPGLDEGKQARLREIAVAGPLLARREQGRIIAYFPRPSDAIPLIDDAGYRAYRRLQPSRYPEGCGSDLPRGLLPLILAEAVKGKPQPAPGFWPLEHLLAWGGGSTVEWGDEEPGPWETEHRTHVAIDRETSASDSGRLFQTDGIDLGRRRLHDSDGRAAGFGASDWVLLTATRERLRAGLIALGGERRLSWITTADEAGPEMPASLPSALTGGFALTLATPAIFSMGWKPGWLDDDLKGEVPGIAGLQVRLRAVAVDRWQSVSGWDIAAWQPKPARKAAAAGAVYWFEVQQGSVEQLSRLWLASVSDDAQDRRDGFGLVVPRPWNSAEFGDL